MKAAQSQDEWLGTAGNQTDPRHHVLVEGEGDVGAAALWVTPGCGRGSVGGAPALALIGAGLHEAALVQDADAGLTGWTLGPPGLTVEAAGFRTTPELRRKRRKRRKRRRRRRRRSGFSLQTLFITLLLSLSLLARCHSGSGSQSGSYLGAADSAVVTAALVTVFIPSASIQNHQASDHTGPTRRCSTKQHR